MQKGLKMRAWFDFESMDRYAPVDVAGITNASLYVHNLIRDQTYEGIYYLLLN